jgi:hypothetical protein
MHDLSLADARALLLAAQGLDRAGAKGATKDGVRAAIRRMGVLQIDTIHVVARSPYLVLWSRLGANDPVWPPHGGPASCRKDPQHRSPQTRVSVPHRIRSFEGGGHPDFLTR